MLTTGARTSPFYIGGAKPCAVDKSVGWSMLRAKLLCVQKYQVLVRLAAPKEGMNTMSVQPSYKSTYNAANNTSQMRSISPG